MDENRRRRCPFRNPYREVHFPLPAWTGICGLDALAYSLAVIAFLRGGGFCERQIRRTLHRTHSVLFFQKHFHNLRTTHGLPLFARCHRLA